MKKLENILRWIKPLNISEFLHDAVKPVQRKCRAINISIRKQKYHMSITHPTTGNETKVNTTSFRATARGIWQWEQMKQRTESTEKMFRTEIGSLKNTSKIHRAVAGLPRRDRGKTQTVVLGIKRGTFLGSIKPRKGCKGTFWQTVSIYNLSRSRITTQDQEKQT